MKLTKIELPKKYEFREGTNELYKKYDGWYKISYSQANSFKDYFYTYLKEYILGFKSPEQGIFADFGGQVGSYLDITDTTTDYPLLSKEDKAILDALKNAHEKGSQFEFEIIIDLEPFGIEKTVLQGFSDKQYLDENGLLVVSDYKTLNLATKKKYYLSEDYKQLYIYGYGLEELGFEIGDIYVTGLGRKGNNTIEGDKNKLRLSGEIEILPKTYTRKKGEEAIKEIVEACKKISEYNSAYKTYFG